ncbi:hypothetical protein BGZ99_008027 [Dissophora globulifera]|uniref:Uncharacterized protein n=1 Tax=Dissophora globulifera TaxID=979702 RepID=A0A9P6UZ63_9FUNG|nr:hypothetical protein BGZ99_008027 [Dissophora globulifera]
MQFKTLAVAAAAFAAVSAQLFDNNTCTQCVFASFPKDTVCATIPAADMGELEAAFAAQNLTLLSAALTKPTTTSCVCHWVATGFTPTGAAASCIAGSPPTCNATQVQQASAGIAQLQPLLHCAGNSTSGTTTTPAAPTPTKSGSSIQMNMPYVLSVAAIGLAALAGL